MDISNSTDIAVASSPGADVSAVTLILLCQVFGLVKEWLHAGGVSTNRGYDDDDQSVEKEMMFSDVECQRYSNLTRWYSDDCENNSMVYDYDVGQSWYQKRKFMRCLTYRFMTEIGANSSCTNNSERSDNNTNIKNTMPLSSKDRLFHSFIADTLNMTSTCTSSNDTVMFHADINGTVFSYDNCDGYYYYVKTERAESKCVHNTSTTGSDTELSYDWCLSYRFMNSLGADSGCSDHFSLRESCDSYEPTMRAVVSTIICIIGLIGNSISLVMFCRGFVDIPTTYQLQWLAFVDITFLVTYWFTRTLYYVMSYANVTSDLYSHGIHPALVVCLNPLRLVAQSCAVWLTVFIVVYRYLAICKPYGNVYSHVMLHGQKYVKLIVILSVLYNFPAFIWFYLESYEKDGQVYIFYKETGLLSDQFYDVYYNYVSGAFVTCLPLIILCFVTVKILVKLSKRQKKKSSMQTSSTPQTSITAVLITILITFAICHIPVFLYFSILQYIPSLDSDDRCGSFMFYIYEFAYVGLLLNSSANGYIYFFMNKSFRDALFSRCECKRNDGPEMIEMAAMGSGMSRRRGEAQ